MEARGDCSFGEYERRLGQLKAGKAVSLDRLSVEMVHGAPEGQAGLVETKDRHASHAEPSSGVQSPW